MSKSIHGFPFWIIEKIFVLLELAFFKLYPIFFLLDSLTFTNVIKLNELSYEINLGVCKLVQTFTNIRKKKDIFLI